MSDCPDPMEDPDGYALWCELNSCPRCEGSGDGNREGDMACRLCEGSGIDPAARETCEEPEYECDPEDAGRD